MQRKHLGEIDPHVIAHERPRRVLASPASTWHLAGNTNKCSPRREIMEIQTTSEDRTWKEKLAAIPGNIKSRSVAKVNDARVAVASVKPRVTAMTMKANDTLRGNPAKWAGIAAGAGLGVGLLGRFLHHRAHHRHMPAVVIIEAAC